MEKIVHVRLSKDIHEKLRVESEKSDRKISSMIRYILIQWTKKFKK